MPLSEDGVDRLTRALWDVECHVHPPDLVWWYDPDRGEVVRGAVWGYRGGESLLTAWALDGDGVHVDVVAWVPTRHTGPRRE